MIASIVAGAMLGLSVALPFGPVSLVCVQRSIMRGFGFGMISGVGAASAHGLFATIALFAQNVIAAELMAWDAAIRLFSAIVLTMLGLRILIRRGRQPALAARGSRAAAFGSSLGLALSNPMSVLPYVAVVSGRGAAGGAGLSSWFVPGVMAGAITWYFVLSSGASVFRASAPERMTRHLNLAAGSMLIVFGLWVGAGAIGQGRP